MHFHGVLGPLQVTANSNQTFAGLWGEAKITTAVFHSNNLPQANVDSFVERIGEGKRMPHRQHALGSESIV